VSSELDEKLSALLDGELAPDEAAALRAELERSPELAARLAALAGVDEGLRTLPGRSVPPGLRARVAAELRASEARPRARRWPLAAALAAAAAALALWAWPRAPREPAPAEAVAEAEDLPVIQVLDVLAELDELEDLGSG
jgi:anti-sigma factor RsiW